MNKTKNIFGLTNLQLAGIRLAILVGHLYILFMMLEYVYINKL